MATPSKQARMLLALKATENSQDPNILAISKAYNVLEATLRHRRAGRPLRCDIPANSRKLTDLEEKTII